MTEVPTVALFTANDRCDRCHARAAVLVVLRTGGSLAFCAHHATRYHAALLPLARRFERHVDLDDAYARPPVRR